MRLLPALLLGVLLALAPSHALARQPGQGMAGLVTIVTVTPEGTGAMLGEAQVASGRAPFVPDPAPESAEMRLEVLDASGALLHAQEFAVPRFQQVPLPEPDKPDNLPPVVPVANPSATLVLPYIPETARLVVKRRATREALDSRVLSHPAVLPAPSARAMERTPYQAGTFYLLILSSGFAAQADFLAKANPIKTYLLTKEPFAAQSSRVEVNMAFQTGSLGCAPGCAGIDRLLCCTSSSVVAAAAASGYGYDEILVIHNTSTYSGGGYRDLGTYQANSYNSYCAVYSGSYATPMALHELGHSFGDLCDEYTYGSEGYTYNSCVNCKPSCTAWSGIDSGCSQSCDARSDYFRPSNSIMLDYTVQAYNQASLKQGLETRLTYFTTRTNRPYVVMVTPPEGSNYWNTNRTTATFNTPMNAASVMESFELRDAVSGASLASSVAYDAATRTATLTAALEDGVTYRAIVGTGAMDDQGTHLDAAKTWTFTVDHTPTPVVPAESAPGLALLFLLLALAGLATFPAPRP